MHTPTCVHAHTFTCMCACTQQRHAHTCTYVYTHAQHMYMCTHIHTCTHTCTGNDPLPPVPKDMRSMACLGSVRSLLFWGVGVERRMAEEESDQAALRMGTSEQLNPSLDPPASSGPHACMPHACVPLSLHHSHSCTHLPPICWEQLESFLHRSVSEGFIFILTSCLERWVEAFFTVFTVRASLRLAFTTHQPLLSTLLVSSQNNPVGRVMLPPFHRWGNWSSKDYVTCCSSLS